MNHERFPRSRIHPLSRWCAPLLALVLLPALTHGAGVINVLLHNSGATSARAEFIGVTHLGAITGSQNSFSSWCSPGATLGTTYYWQFADYSNIGGTITLVCQTGGTGAGPLTTNTITVAPLASGTRTDTWEIGGVPPDTYYTNHFTWANGTLLGRMVQANGNSPVFPQTFWAEPHSDWSWTFVTTNVAGWMTIDDVDGPYHADLTNNATVSQTYTPPVVNGSGSSSNVLWSGDTNSGPALDSTIREGFGTLYSTLNEGFQGVQTGVKDTGNQIVNAINAKSFSANVTNINNVTVTGVFNGLEALNAISNMMANSGDDGAAASNNAPWMFNGGILDKANTEAGSLKTAIANAQGTFGSFEGIGSVPEPDMTIHIANPMFTADLDLNPMHESTLQAIANAFRNCIIWAATLYFCYWGIKLVIDTFNNLFLIPTPSEGTVIGKVLSPFVGMSRALTFFMSLPLIAAFFLLLYSVVSWLDKFRVDQASYLYNLAATPFKQGSLPQIGLYLFTSFIPWDYLLLLLEAGIAWWLFIESSAAIVRFACKALIK